MDRAIRQNLTSDDSYYIRLSSKRLVSGKYQVKFHVIQKEGEVRYGYLLAKAGEKLSTVVNKIRTKLEELDYTFGYFHFYKTGEGVENEENFMIFENGINSN